MVQGHSSVRAHLATEYSLLLSLYGRSKDQHRHQLFLRRLEAVLRLTRLVIKQYAACASLESTPAGSSSVTPGLKSGALTPLVPPKAGETESVVGGEEGEERLKDLIKRFIRSLLLAADITGQMLQLHHFVPLQTMLLSSYARLFAICVHLCPLLGLNLGDVLSGAETRDIALLAKAGPKRGEWEKREVREFELEGGGGAGMGGGGIGGGADLGEVVSREEMMGMSVEREDEESPVASPTPKPTTKEKRRPEPETVSEEELEPSPEPVKVKKKKKADALDEIFSYSSKPKKSKRDAMDDVFSTSASTPTSDVPKKKKKADALDDIFSSSKLDKPKKPKPKSAADSLDDIFSAPKAKKSRLTDDVASPKKGDKPKKKEKLKKKKKDAMDDIFGF